MLRETAPQFPWTIMLRDNVVVQEVHGALLAIEQLVRDHATPPSPPSARPNPRPRPLLCLLRSGSGSGSGSGPGPGSGSGSGRCC